MTIRVAALAAALLAFAPAIHAAGPLGASRATTTTAAPASQPAAAPVSVTPATPVAVAMGTASVADVAVVWDEMFLNGFETP